MHIISRLVINYLGRNEVSFILIGEGLIVGGSGFDGVVG